MLQDFLTTRYIGKMNFYEFDSMNFRKILLFVYTFLEVSCSLLDQKIKIDSMFETLKKNTTVKENNIQRTSVTRFPVLLVKFLSRIVLPPLDLFRKLPRRLLT